MAGRGVAPVARVLILVLVAAFPGCRAIGDWFAGEPQSFRQWQSAEELFDSEQYAQAGVAYRAWLADYRDSEDVLRPFVLYRLGECYRLTRDHQRAIEVYTKVIQAYADSPNPKVKELVDKVVKPRLEDIRPVAELGQAEERGGPNR